MVYEEIKHGQTLTAWILEGMNHFSFLCIFEARSYLISNGQWRTIQDHSNSILGDWRVWPEKRSRSWMIMKAAWRNGLCWSGGGGGVMSRMGSRKTRRSLVQSTVRSTPVRWTLTSSTTRHTFIRMNSFNILSKLIMSIDWAWSFLVSLIVREEGQELALSVFTSLSFPEAVILQVKNYCRPPVRLVIMRWYHQEQVILSSLQKLLENATEDESS